ncbi:sensor histidine kinase [Bailinhaonella thermotolerans]|uniref:Oxygen sensor histidine kinase NreB n=2 Tax=Bailinhaonella thermotolerans TaxID=1070861 RepID=A0A3A4ASN2_9ACTN|nr:sensor histidine kinase [Bailinhaonella thermotolerans]
MHAGFFLLLAASAARLVTRHGVHAETGLRLALCVALAVVYAAGVIAWPGLRGPGPRVWLGVVIALWATLVIVAPSFAWCAVPLQFTALRLLPPRAVVALAAVLTALVAFAQARLSRQLDPSMILAPVAVAMMITVIFMTLQRLVDDLVQTRGELAAAQRAAGVMEERARLSREIHDTLAQGLTSTRLLLQAADRAWTADPASARGYVRRAERAVGANLAEARRFVRDLAPPDLDAGSLPAALRALAGRAAAEGGFAVEFRAEGGEYALDGDTQAALLRIAQAALANVREHAGAGRAVLTLTYLDDEVTLDVRDDGAGWDGEAPPPGRGHGLPAMRHRAEALGGRLVVESAPGEGTAVAAAIPRRRP